MHQWQLIRRKTLGKSFGEAGLTGAFVRQAQQPHHHPACLPIRQPFSQAFERTTVDLARE
jgi:hypothetical protein